MATLPVLSGRDVVRAFGNDGWRAARQRGSHIVLLKDGSIATLSVPDQLGAVVNSPISIATVDYSLR